MWITDGLNTRLYAYTLATGARDAAKEFDLTANTQRTGIWSDGTTLWVADFHADTLFAYTLANGARDLARDITLSQPFPQGVSGKGSTIWVADAGLAVFGVPTTSHRVYSYRLPPSSPNDVTLSSLSLSPSPLVPLFTANLRPAFSYARASYRVAVPNQASRVTVSAVANNSGTMVAYLDANGDALVDADDDAMGFQVDVAVGETEIAMRLASGGTALTYTVVVERDSATLYGWTPSKDFNNLLQNNPSLASDQIRGVWGDETTIYTAPLSVPKVFAYTRATEARDESKDIATNQGPLLETDNGSKAGIWSNGTTMWVLNYPFGEDTDGNDIGDGTGKLFAFKLSDGTRDTAKEFALHLEETFAARGIWSDGTTVWISNYKDAKLFAYTLATGASVPASDITLHHLNHSAQGIWSDETTIWVAQWDSPKFFAYTLATGAYDPDNDFDRVPGNHFPRGVWSDGTTLYVTDYYDKKLFAYKMTNTAAAGTPAITAPNVFRVPAVLGVDLSGITDTDGVTNIATNATYKWQRFNAAGTTLETDSIGTDATYTLTDADATKTLKVVVNFTDDASNSEGPLTSAATSAITAAASCATPTYVGGATQVWTAKVGVGKNSDFYGYYDDTTLDFGSLDQTRFSISPNNYRVDRVFTQPGPSLAFSMKSDFTSDEQKTLALHICDQAFAFSAAGAPSSGSTYAFLRSAFPGADMDWSPHAERTIYLSQDTAAPTFVSATVNGSTLVVTLSEDLGAAASLVNSAFTVKKGNSGTTQTLSGTPSISGSTVTLTLATAVTATDTAVKVAYTKPTSGSANKLIDKFGNETATFPDQDVTIDTTDLAPPSLTSAVVLADGNTIQLAFSEDLQSANLPPAAAFTVTAGGSAVTVTGVAAESTADVLQITVSPLIGQGQTVVVAYEDPTAVDDANAIQDAAGNDTPDFTTGSGSVPAVTNNSALTNEVLASWSLTPAGLAVGDQFRLIFLSSTKRNALSTDIGDYNTFVQDRAAAGHADILAYSGGFGVIGCTAAVDARDNTATTGTGVPIYWLDGAKVADDYADFYDGSWDDEVNDKDESGADAHDTSLEDNYPFTGCMDDGTESFAGATNPRSLGATNGNVRIGRLNASGSVQDPIDGNDVAGTDATRPMYGLSAVFEVSSSPSTNPNAPAAVSDVAVVPEPRTTDSLTVSWSAPDNTGKPALTGYDVRYGQDEDNWTTVRQNDAASTTLVITGLRPNNYYDVQVRALSAEYSGPWSSNAEGATISPAETVLANHPMVPDDLGPGDSFRLLYITEDTTAATGTGIHAYHTIAFDGVVRIRDSGNLMEEWHEIIFGQIALLSTPGADARLITDTTWDETDRGVPIYWVNGARVADDYADFYDGTWADEANPTSGLGQPHSLADPVPWTGTDHDGTELIDGTASRAVGQSNVGVGAPGSTASGAGPLNGDAAFASTQERPLYGLWHVMVVDENLRLVTNFYQPEVGNVGNIRAAVRAQLFTTGPHSSGYGISSIEVEKGSETATFLGTVAIHTTDGDGDPDLADGLHATLSLENTGSSIWTLAAPAGTVLKPSTTYALVFKGDAGTYPDLYTTPADGEDTPADGWSLADTLVYDSGSGWVDNTAGRSLVIEMIGPLAAAVANNAPTVENEIPDQTAAAGTPFTYTFPTNTFHDADGDTLTYTAIQDDSDRILPTWITFDASTQTFSGTPAVADIKSLFIKVTATDGTASVSDTFIIRVVTAPTSVTMTDVLSTWSLRPAAMNVGDQFRLLFLSSTQRDAQSATISDYNSFIQTRVVAGHADIQTHTIGFRAVGCTETIDARDNTFTTGTGVPIYWLNGAKVADDYADFYDGSWDDEVNDKDESGIRRARHLPGSQLSLDRLHQRWHRSNQ